MASVSFSNPTMATAEFKNLPRTIGHRGKRVVNFQPTFPHKHQLRFSRIPTLLSSSTTQYSVEGDPEEDCVEHLRVPNSWLDPSKASELLLQGLVFAYHWMDSWCATCMNERFQESEWLRVTLHKWLDDEYCPEETNIKISEVASHSFYKSLMEKKTDLGEILLELVQELGSISYQESFHGAFSSANAAVNLIIQRIQQN